jgi:hypothetical protein
MSVASARSFQSEVSSHMDSSLTFVMALCPKSNRTSHYRPNHQAQKRFRRLTTPFERMQTKIPITLKSEASVKCEPCKEMTNPSILLLFDYLQRAILVPSNDDRTVRSTIPILRNSDMPMKPTTYDADHGAFDQVPEVSAYTLLMALCPDHS